MDRILYIDVDIGIINEEIQIDVEEGSHGGIFPYYEGSYEISPSIHEKTLETKNKSMEKDLKVLQIPMHKFDNTSNGQTIVIGGI